LAYSTLSLGALLVGLGAAQRRAQLVDLLLADRVDADELLGTRQVGAGQLRLGLQRGDLRLGAGHLGAEGARVDGEQRVALLDELAFLEAHRIDGAGDAGAHLDGVRRFQPGGELVEFLHFALRGRRDRHRRRATMAARAASAVLFLAAGGEQDNKKGS
jgi:hypothetical protein